MNKLVEAERDSRNDATSSKSGSQKQRELDLPDKSRSVKSPANQCDDNSGTTTSIRSREMPDKPIVATKNKTSKK